MKVCIDSRISMFYLNILPGNEGLVCSMYGLSRVVCSMECSMYGLSSVVGSMVCSMYGHGQRSSLFYVWAQ